MEGIWKRQFWRAASCALLMGMASGSALAQSVEAKPEEYKDLLKIHEELPSLGDNPFGDSISLYTGELSFHQTDISLKGAGPEVSISRSFSAGRYGASLNLSTGVNAMPRHGAFADWELDLPRITTLVGG